jgi:hypothetical protein
VKLDPSYGKITARVEKIVSSASDPSQGKKAFYIDLDLVPCLSNEVSSNMNHNFQKISNEIKYQAGLDHSLCIDKDN